MPDSEPRVETGRPLLIGGLRDHLTYADAAAGQKIPAQWAKAAPHFGSVPAQIGRITYGLSFPDRGGFDYVAGVEVSSPSGLPAEWTTASVPAQRYAVFTHSGHVSKLHGALGSIWREWLPASGHQALQPSPGEPAFFERYGEGFDPATGMGDIEIWIPIQAK